MSLNLLAPMGAASQLVTGSLTAIEPVTSQTIFTSHLPSPNSGIVLVSGTAYFIYVGLVAYPMTPKYVRLYISSTGSGAQTAEIGLFSTPVAPNFSSQSLTKLVATGTVDDLTTTGIKRNTSAFATSIPAGTHLWAGCRAVMGSGQPSAQAVFLDMGLGCVLITSGASALTGVGPWTGAVPSLISTAVAPRAIVTLT